MLFLSPALRNVEFSSVMGRNRFEAIRSLIHFVDDTDFEGKPKPGEPTYNRAAKILPVVEAVLRNGRVLYRMPKEVSMDEQTTASRGNADWVAVPACVSCPGRHTLSACDDVSKRPSSPCVCAARVAIMLYNPKKSTRFGFKDYSLNDPFTGYALFRVVALFESRCR